MAEDMLFQFSLFMLGAVVVAGLCHVRGWSSAIPLIVYGAIAGLLPAAPSLPKDPEWVLVLVLAPLVFGEALTTSIIDLRKVRRPVLILATALVVFGAICVGAVAKLVMPGMWWSVAFALGAILAPTDAVAVSATAKRAGLPRSLVNILEGESLVNDGTALTLLRVCVAAAAVGSVDAGRISLILVTSVVGGLAVGVLGGLALVRVLRWSHDTTVTNALIVVAPFAVYTGAEFVHGSGILAVVIAGVMVAHVTASEAEYSGRLQATHVWRTLTFVLQSVAFVLIGVEITVVLGGLPREDLPTLLVAVPLVFLVLVASRTLFMFAARRMIGLGEGRAWVIAAWAGTRGPVSALAAFSLPLFSGSHLLPDREMVVAITLCVVVITLLLAPTVTALARRLQLPKSNDQRLLRRARVALAKASLERLDEMEETADRRDSPIPEDVLQGLRAQIEVRLQQAEIKVSGSTTRPLPLSQMRSMALEMTRAEQEELLRLRDEEGLPDELMRSLQKEIDIRVRALRLSR